MSAPRLIGVLGGMGPEATIVFQQKLLTQVAAWDDADHVPLLIDVNPQVPSRIAHLIEKTGEDPGPVLAAMARRLQSAGAEALVMPCNTAHGYAAAISDAVEIPLLNIIELASDHVARLLGNAGRVGILASPALHHTGLFETALERRGLKSMWPSSQNEMLAAIRVIKAGNDIKSAETALIASSREMAQAGADVQLIACSEFSIIAGCLDAEIEAIDTLDLLARAAAEASLA